MRALEFYSGIGGLHLALVRSHVSAEIVRAFDWDQNACEVYSANFGQGIAQKVLFTASFLFSRPLSEVQTDISTLTAQYVATLDASLWLLSPACQPYTVLNPSAKGDKDPRAKSFLYLIQTVLPELVSMEKHPTHFLVENVAGFEASIGSTTRQILTSTLQSLGYYIAEFLLTPLQFGIPNSRLRYYLLAKRSPFAQPGDPHPLSPLRHIPGAGCEDWVDTRDEPSATAAAHQDVTEIREYLDPDPASEEDYSIPEKVLRKWGRLFDIVLPSARRSCCFTRGYNQLVERAGSIVQLNEDEDTTSVFDAFLDAQTTSRPEDAVRILDCLRLRYFTPDELLRIFAFNPLRTPQTFTWPPSVSRKVKYRLIGNSVNVRVVTELIRYLFRE
ncbi:unnamed protein product [Mycena citricolor]|uniref:tRNA (cytosine(38)-C(5))-methyltransferase n=1 Tax=Mycena citricolor TaxID=2018698 RepID=A0AAD2HS52_9AGAR|nr:unnamed protein product [Mycena citricolor]